MAFSLNDKRTPLEQFLQGESVTAYEFMGSHFVNWGRQRRRCVQSMGTKRTFRIRCR